MWNVKLHSAGVLTNIRRAVFAIAIVMGGLAGNDVQAAVATCTVEHLQSVAPKGTTIKQINNIEALGGPIPVTTNGVAHLPATANSSEACFFTGSIVTNPAAGTTANFAAVLPTREKWNKKFLFQGCGGNCGVVHLGVFGQVQRGYAVWSTDDGHVAAKPIRANIPTSADSTWATLSPGVINQEALEDFHQRAVHEVAEAGKQFTQNFFGADKLERSYFIGCSDGGREGMVALTYYPTDFDGIIAGAPYFDMSNEIYTTLIGVLAQLRTPHAAISHGQFKTVDRLVMAMCDPVDGLKDGLVQSPEQCTFDPYADLPKCKSSQTFDSCFTSDQLDTLSVIFSAITNEMGAVVYPGFSFTDTARNLWDWIGFPGAPTDRQGAHPWETNPVEQAQGWFWAEGTLRHLVYANASDFDAQKTPGIRFQRSSDGRLRAVIPQATATFAARKNSKGSGATPEKAAAFFKQGRKLILYHGYSDGLITPYRTIQYYRTLAAQNGGYGKLQNNALLFMIPNMDHCFGGSGPNFFGQNSALGVASPCGARDAILESLENWVEHDKKPGSIEAIQYGDEEANKTVVRRLPLCPYPAIPQYKGTGNINSADNWTCAPGDERLAQVGPAGKRVGLDAPLRQPF